MIYIFGPSCSGKSTLSKALQESLGCKWTYLDRDQLIEERLCTNDTADKTLEEKIASIKERVIVDAQIPWAEKRETEIYCLLLPPLETLLERDMKRTKNLNRSEQRALYAKEYVITTYNTLSKMDREKFDICVDSSKVSVEETVLKVVQLLKKEGLDIF